jgi:hypothetical protein
MEDGNKGRSRRRRSSGLTYDLAYGLGWFSIGLGAAEVIAPGALARTLGMRGSEPILRAYGLREIATGIGILSSNNPAPWLWGRVGGDALDIATLATGYTDSNPRKENVGIALAAVAGVTILDVVCAQALSMDRADAHEQRYFDYSDRSGLPRPPQEMRGAARDFEVPPDMRAPEALQPYGS